GLAHMIAQLQDPHTTYKSMCYNQFLFVQPLSTYGVFENGRQQVKVATVLNNLDPRLDTNLVDCEVTHIDGRPAFEGRFGLDFWHLQAFVMKPIRLTSFYCCCCCRCRCCC